jgi:hypothetical protein
VTAEDNHAMDSLCGGRASQQEGSKSRLSIHAEVPFRDSSTSDNCNWYFKIFDTVKLNELNQSTDKNQLDFDYDEEKQSLHIYLAGTFPMR